MPIGGIFFLFMSSILILAGINDRTVLDEGWYGLEKSPEGILYRASSPKSTFIIPVLNPSILLTFLLAGRPEHTGEPLSFTITSNDSTLADFQLNTNHWTTRQVNVSLKNEQRIHLKVKNPWSPDNIYKNGDVRSLGILLSAIRIEM